MIISCEVSLYPLGVEDLGPAIEVFVEALSNSGLEVETGPMSSYVTGEAAAVFDGLRRAFETAANGGAIVMTATLSNACPLPDR